MKRKLAKTTSQELEVVIPMDYEATSGGGLVVHCRLGRLSQKLNDYTAEMTAAARAKQMQIEDVRFDFDLPSMCLKVGLKGSCDEK